MPAERGASLSAGKASAHLIWGRFDRISYRYSHGDKMSQFVLNEAELELAHAIGRGEVFQPKTAIQSIVRAEAIRHIMLGLEVRREGEDEPFTVALTPTGLVIHGATIEGALMLDDAAAADGGFLPSLVLKNCTFEAAVSLCRSRLRHLSLAGSRLRHLCGNGVNVAGLLDLSSLSTAENGRAKTGAEGQGRCWIELREARIDGNLVGSYASLVAPAPRPSIFPGMRRAEYALDLRAATVGGELTLSPKFIACGGLNIRSARIDKDVILTGATLTEVEEYALHAAGVKIGGAALFNVWTTEDGPAPFTAYGQVTFLDSVVTGSVELRGASVQSFLANNARIGGAALLGTWESAGVIFPFESRKGGVSLDAANISGNLDMSGARIIKVAAQNAYIGGAALLRAFDGSRKSWRCMIEGELSLAGAKIVGNLDLNGSTLGSINIRNAEIGGSIDFETWRGRDRILHFVSSDDIIMSGAKITGGINAKGASIKGLNANNAQIGGAALLRVWYSGEDAVPFTSRGDISLMGCRIAGSLVMAGASVKTVLAINAEIGGGAFLTAWKGTRDLHRFEATEEIFLTGSKIGGNLELNGAKLYGLTAQNIDVGGSALLRAWDGLNTIIPFSADSHVNLSGAIIRVDLDFSGCKICDTLCAENTEIGGNVWFVPWVSMALSAEQHFRTSGSIQLSGTKIRGILSVKDIDVHPKRQEPGKIDLSHSSVEILDDEDGAAWGDDMVLRLEGFRCARLAVNRPSDSSRSLFPAKADTASGSRPTASVARLRWLNLQYPPPRRQPNIRDYNPDAYDRLARAFRATGYFVDARAITREKLRVERRISETKLARPFLALYAFCFDSGLSPRRAVATFVSLVLAGWIATWIADRGSTSPVLVLATDTVSTIVVPAPVGSGRFLPGISVASEKSIAYELPCGDEIEPLLYALDIFVPVLELHQEHRCRITKRKIGLAWQIGRALYAVLGWIVTALTILTISGVTRRHLEN